MNRYKNYYGHETKSQIELIVGKVCDFFDGIAIIDDFDNDKRNNAYNLVIETFCAETQLGLCPDNVHTSGFGIAQFDNSGFKHAKGRSDKYRDGLYNAFRIDISSIEIIELRYNVLLSAIFCRLFYKTKPEAIPSTREGRAKYWKKYYNTSKGAGTIKHYLESCERLLG